MSIKLETQDSELSQFKLTNTNGKSITLGSTDEFVGPMESVLMALASCSTIDVVMILKKMRQEVSKIEVKVDGDRREDIPRTYTHIKAHFTIYGHVKESKAEQAINSSFTKYCSVSKMIEKSASIVSSFTIINQH